MRGVEYCYNDELPINRSPERKKFGLFIRIEENASFAETMNIKWYLVRIRTKKMRAIIGILYMAFQEGTVSIGLMVLFFGKPLRKTPNSG